MDKAEAIDKVKIYAEEVIKHFVVKNVVLFGSYARDNAQKYSDIDVAVVVKNNNMEFIDYAPLLWKLTRNIDVRIEPVLIEEDNDVSGFLEEIYKNGIIIYSSPVKD
jgi:predicted nucleotidyltransferase